MTTSSGTALDRFQYGYDRDGNPLYKDNKVQASMSELYHANSAASGDNNSAYDKLNRLVAFRRGTLTSSSNNGSGLDTVTTGNLSSLTGKTRTWTLDAIGNQTATSTDGTGNSVTVNSGNQITSGFGSPAYSYDDNGNTTSITGSSTYLNYDAWNRPVNWSASILSYVNGRFEYDALGRRIEALAARGKSPFPLASMP